MNDIILLTFVEGKIVGCLITANITPLFLKGEMDKPRMAVGERDF